MKFEKIKIIATHITLIIFVFMFNYSCNEVIPKENKIIISTTHKDIQTDKYYTFIDTIINNYFINVCAINNKEYFYIKINNKTLDSFSYSYIDTSNLRPQVIQIDNENYSNFVFQDNYLLLVIPWFNINEYHCFIYKLNAENDKVECFSTFDFSGNIVFNPKKESLEYFSIMQVETYKDLPFNKLIERKTVIKLDKIFKTDCF
jgi:hypothetical protein